MTDDYHDQEWPRTRKIQVLGGGTAVIAVLGVLLYCAQPATGTTPAATTVASTPANPSAPAPTSTPAQLALAAPPAISNPPALTNQPQRTPVPPPPPPRLVPFHAARGTAAALHTPTRRATGISTVYDPDHDGDIDCRPHHHQRHCEK